MNWKSYAFGPINITTNDAINLVKESVHKLGYSVKVLNDNAPPTSLTGPFILNDGNRVPYCEMRWVDNTHNGYYIEAQVDMERKTLIELNVISRELNRKSPSVSVTPAIDMGQGKTPNGMSFNPSAPKRFHQ